MNSPRDRSANLESPRPDYFGEISTRYSEFRPDYPDALYEYLASESAGRVRVWDCGTGSGQAAARLGRWFDEVYASDMSRDQLRSARRDPKILYHVALAEGPALRTSSIDLVTAAQAAHWFDMDRFAEAARRVLRGDGFVAVWTYGHLYVDDRVDEVVRRFYHEVVGPYWPPSRRHVETEYGSLHFPFDEFETPTFEIRRPATYEWLLGYLGTWSSVRRYTQKRGRDPVAESAGELRAAWGDESPKTARWPVHMRAGR